MPVIQVPSYFETRRLIIRKYEKENSNALLNLILKNKERLKETGVITDIVYNMKVLEDAEVYIRQTKAGWLLKNLYTFGAWLKETNELIGEYKIFNINWETKSAETGGFLDYRYEGKFLLQEMAGVFNRILFEHMNFDTMIVSCRKDNLVSQFSIRKSKIFEELGEMNNMLLYSLSKEKYFEWKQKVQF